MSKPTGRWVALSPFRQTVDDLLSFSVRTTYTVERRMDLAPLIAGEAYPPFENGLPRYVRLKNAAVKKKTKSDFKL